MNANINTNGARKANKLQFTIRCHNNTQSRRHVYTRLDVPTLCCNTCRLPVVFINWLQPKLLLNEIRLSALTLCWNMFRLPVVVINGLEPKWLRPLGCGRLVASAQAVGHNISNLKCFMFNYVGMIYYYILYFYKPVVSRVGVHAHEVRIYNCCFDFVVDLVCFGWALFWTFFNCVLIIHNWWSRKNLLPVFEYWIF